MPNLLPGAKSLRVVAPILTGIIDQRQQLAFQMWKRTPLVGNAIANAVNLVSCLSAWVAIRETVTNILKQPTNLRFGTLEQEAGPA